MNLLFAEALSTELVEDGTGNKLCVARSLDQSSHKYKIINQLFKSKTIAYFLKIGDCLNTFLNNEIPLIFVTDWTDPTEMVGLRLETDGQTKDYPNLCFLAFNTNWDDIDSSGIEDIFAHEFSHLWLHLLGFNFNLSKSNKFHTCTAVTDPFMAFSEGFAEHLEIVTKDLGNSMNKKPEFWDYGYDINAWLSLRDEQLRYYGVINNRFIYRTANPNLKDYETYHQIHMAHITSSAFMPENIKNASQMMASEGVIASVFYQMYQNDILKNSFLEDDFYLQFGIEKSDLSPLENLYIKIIYTMSKIDLNKPSLMIDFIKSYGQVFPIEKETLYDLFLKVTHFSTVSLEAKKIFEDLYRIGRQGEIEAFKTCLKHTMAWKKDKFEKVMEGQSSLDHGLYKEIWLDTDQDIAPVPWLADKKVKYRFNINCGSEIDFLALDQMTLDQAQKLVEIRDSKGGFKSLDDFNSILKNIVEAL
jgi:hypothetical protein